MNTSLTVPEVVGQLREDRGLETAELNAKRVLSEPLVYQRHGEHSWARDLAFGSDESHEQYRDARERLERHGRQIDALPRETRTNPDAEMEMRLNPNTETGHGGEFAPPAWINKYFATARRADQVVQRLVADLGQEFDMPQGVSSINLPRLTQGTLVNDQTPGGPTDEVEVETAAVKAQSQMYTGMSDWSIQTLEQSPSTASLDFVVFKDMSESLDAELELDFITGRGEAQWEALGMLNTTGIGLINYATLEAKTIFETIGKANAKVGIERKRPPTAVFMSTARLQYLATVPITSEQRPLLLTDNVGNAFPMASMAGIPIYVNDAIPRTWKQLSTSTPGGWIVGGEEEPMISARVDGFMLWHSPLQTRVLKGVQSSSLGVRFQLWRTTASMLHRYPSAITAIIGSGTKVNAGWY